MKWLNVVAGESPTLEGTMADTAFRPAELLPGSATRERLRELDDSGVASAFLDGESRAFDELVNRYQNRLLNFVYRTTGDRERAEDLVQEVFVRVYRHIHRFDRSRKFSTWIYTIASNLAKNELRNRSRNPLVLFQTTAPVDPGAEVTIRFTIWDTGDENLDSTVLVDGFEWIANGGTVGVGTNPLRDPK